jgi:hypothetical protein
MGSVLVSAMENIERPTIGLLNVGTEDIKGNDVVKATSKLLQADHERGALNYGNVEGNDIFKGTTDIVVCDGFTGNVTLKAVEAWRASSPTPSSRIHPQSADHAERADRSRCPEQHQETPVAIALQRRQFAGPARPGVQEPWRRRCIFF